MTGRLKSWDGSAWVYAGGPGAAGASGVLDYINLQDQRTSGTSGGDPSTGSWVDRTLQTEVTDTGSHCSLSSNHFTLDAGTYQISATAQFGNVGGCKLRLYNVTDSATVLVGTTGFSRTASSLAGMGDTAVRGVFTVAAGKALALQQWIEVSDAAGYSTGKALTTGEVEVYCIVELWKRA